MKKWRIALLTLLAAGCAPGRSDRDTADHRPAARLAHSLSIIRTATPAQPKVLRVLFYGQSISTPKWTDQATAHLRATYPNVRFEVRNLAIGGFASPFLERTVARDLAETYPDLVVFHVYGDHRAYERIIRTIRSETAADIILQTDHVIDRVEPLCPEGIHLSLSEIPGCRGRFWYRQNLWSDHMAGVVIPELADEYGLAVEPRRGEWAEWLRRTGTPPQALLVDGLHPNDRGWRLMATLFGRWFDRVVASWNGETGDLVTHLPAPPAGGTRTFSFDGNRVELIASRPIGDGVRVLVDGRRPADLDGCWQNSRTSHLMNMPDWPALLQVWIDPSLHRADQWIVTLRNADPVKRTFAFDLADAQGAQGSGTGDADFRSPSGTVMIKATDWMIPEEEIGEGDGFQVRWDRHFVCTDQAPVALTADTNEVRHVLATGLANRRHQVTLTLSPQAAGAVREIRLYRPPLSD